MYGNASVLQAAMWFRLNRVRLRELGSMIRHGWVNPGMLCMTAPKLPLRCRLPLAAASGQVAEDYPDPFVSCFCPTMCSYSIQSLHSVAEPCQISEELVRRRNYGGSVR